MTRDDADRVTLVRAGETGAPVPADGYTGLADRWSAHATSWLGGADGWSRTALGTHLVRTYGTKGMTAGQADAEAIGFADLCSWRLHLSETGKGEEFRRFGRGNTRYANAARHAMAWVASLVPRPVVTQVRDTWILLDQGRDAASILLSPVAWRSDDREGCEERLAVMMAQRAAYDRFAETVIDPVTEDTHLHGVTITASKRKNGLLRVEVARGGREAGKVGLLPCGLDTFHALGRLALSGGRDLASDLRGKEIGSAMQDLADRVGGHPTLPSGTLGSGGMLNHNSARFHARRMAAGTAFGLDDEAQGRYMVVVQGSAEARFAGRHADGPNVAVTLKALHRRMGGIPHVVMDGHDDVHEAWGWIALDDGRVLTLSGLHSPSDVERHLAGEAKRYSNRPGTFDEIATAVPEGFAAAAETQADWVLYDAGLLDRRPEPMTPVVATSRDQRGRVLEAYEEMIRGTAPSPA